METISKMNQNSHNEEVNETVGAFIIETEKYDFSTDVYFNGAITTLKQENSLLTTAIKASMANSEKSHFDEQRDLAGKGLFLCTNAASLLPDKNIAEPAKAVSKILDKYTTSIFRVNYDKETAFINSLLEELETLNTEIAAIPQLKLHVDNLKQCQTNFINAKDKYIDAKIDSKATQSAYKQKNVVRKLMNEKIISYLNLMSTFNKDIYGALAAKCSELIEHNNSRVKRRTSGSSVNQKETTK